MGTSYYGYTFDCCNGLVINGHKNDCEVTKAYIEGVELGREMGMREALTEAGCAECQHNIKTLIREKNKREDEVSGM